MSIPGLILSEQPGPPTINGNAVYAHLLSSYVAYPDPWSYVPERAECMGYLVPARGDRSCRVWTA